MTTHTFTLAEQDGYRRGAFPTSIPFSFARGDLLTTRNARLLNAEGKEIAAQIDVTVTWEDDSVKTADLVFGARVPIHDSADFTLERGPEIGPSVDGSFVNAGYPHAVINIGSWPYADEAYHREDDISERVDIDHLSKATRLHLAAALTLDRA